MSLGSFFSTGGTKSKPVNPKQSENLNEALDLYGGQLGQNNNVWQGDRVAGFTGTQQGVLGATSNFLPMFSTPQQTGTPLFDETGTALKGLLAGEAGGQRITPEETERYFKTSVYDPAMYTLKNDVLPTVDAGYAGGNFFGSGRANARERVVSDTARDLNTARGDLNWNVVQQNQALDEAKANRAQTAVGQGMQYAQTPMQLAAAQLGGLNDLFGIGQEGQTQEQKELEAQITKYAEENQITDPTNLAILLSLIGSNVQMASETKNAGLGAGMAGDFLYGTSQGVRGAVS